MSQFAHNKHNRPSHCHIREEKNSTIQYAVASCPCESNEDKNFACLNHLDSKNESFSSMSVFDGHGGSATAQILSAQYNDCMVRHVLNLYRTYTSLQSEKQGYGDENWKTLMNDLQGKHVHDAIICEATRRACVEMDKMAKKTTDSGSTLVSLFVANQQGSTGTRVYCSNVGDSRCIMLRACDLKDALNKSGINNNILSGQPGQAIDESAHPTTQLAQSSAIAEKAFSTPSTPRTPSTTSRARTFGSFSMSSSSASQSAKTSSAQYTTVVHLMSEDHKLSVLRERMRVKTRTPVEWRKLPADASAIFLPDFCRAIAPESFLPMRSYKSLKSLDGMHLSNSRERPLARLSSGGLVRSSHGGPQDSQLSQHGGGSPRTPPISTHAVPLTPPKAVGTYHRSGGSSRDNSRHGSNLSPSSSFHGSRTVLGGSTKAINTGTPPSLSGNNSLNNSRRGGNSGKGDLNNSGKVSLSVSGKGDMAVPLVRSNIAHLVDHMCLTNNSNHDKVEQQAFSGNTSPGEKTVATTPTTTTGTTGGSGGGMLGGGSGGNSTHHLVLPQDLKGLQFIFDWGYPKDEVETSAGVFIDLLTTSTNALHGNNIHNGVSSNSLVGSSSTVLNEFDSECDGLATAAINAPNQESFISQRIGQNGETAGPEAIFSRFNSSIMMTRSIGDLYGPRSCVCIPEVSAITISEDSHARFVLASDGLWDVVSIEDVRQVGLSDKYRDPKVFAQYLALKAQRRRERGNLRKDDITVIVTDIHPSMFHAVNNISNGKGFLPTAAAALFGTSSSHSSSHGGMGLTTTSSFISTRTSSSHATSSHSMNHGSRSSTTSSSSTSPKSSDKEKCVCS